MKITFLLPGYFPGPSGGIRVVYEYANQLVSRGHEVTVVHPRRLMNVPLAETLTFRGWARETVTRLVNVALPPPRIDWQPVDGRVNLLYVPNSESRYLPDGDVVFATGWTTVRSVLEYPRTKGTKFYLIQGYESYHARKDLVDATWRSPLKKVVIAKWMVDLGKELGCEDLTYIPNAIDRKRYRLTQPIEGRPRQVAMLFSPVLIKGAADGFGALRIVRKQFPDLKVVVFGLSRRVRWIPNWVTYYRNPSQEFLISEIYNQSSIFLAPSWSEGSPLPPAEAAACGCAIVATDIGGFREYIDHGITGLLSSPKDQKGLAGNIGLLLANERLRVQLARRCNDSVALRSWENSADLLEKVIVGTVRTEQPALENPPVLRHS